MRTNHDLVTDNRMRSTDGAPRETFDLAATRRSLLQSTGLAASGAVVLGLLGSTERAAAQTANVDVQILNFALNFEYLGAEFYLHATTGGTLSASQTSGLGNAGTVTGGSPVPFSDPVVQGLASELAADEVNHVEFIRAVLGSSVAVARPQIDFAASFTAAARAGNLISQTDTFSPFADDSSFLLGAYLLEDVCVTALHGAAPLITNKQVLDYAGGLLGTEAYQAGAIRTLCFQRSLFRQTQQISALRYYLDGTGNDDQGVGADQSTITGGVQTAANITPTDNTARAFNRTPRQVLNIAYGAANASQGQFFPNGVNLGPGPSIVG